MNARCKNPARPAALALFFSLAVLVAWLGVSVGPASAEEPPLLTLDDAIAHALEHSAALGASSAAAAAAEEGWRERKAARLPRVELEANWLRTTNPVAVFGNLLSQERFGEENFDPAFLNQPPAQSNTQERLRLTQPLWTGGRLAAAIEVGDRQRDAAVAGRERARQELVYRVTDRYTGAIVAEKYLALSVASVKTAEASVELVGDLFQGGLVVESDLLQAKVRLSQVRERQARAESDAGVARAALNLELGRDLATPFRLPTEVSLPDAVAQPVEVGAALQALVAEASSARPDLAAARAQAAAAAAGSRAKRRAHRPQLGFEGAWERNSPSLFDSAGSNWSVGVGLRWTAFDGFATRAKVGRAEAEQRRAEELVRLAEQGVALEVESALREMESARRRLDQAGEAIELARRSFEIVADRYREGLTTVVELLDAETSLTATRTRELAARRDVVLARAALDLAVGRL